MRPRQKTTWDQSFGIEKTGVEQRLGIDLRGGKTFNKLGGERTTSPSRAPVSKKGKRQWVVAKWGDKLKMSGREGDSGDS